MAVIANDCNYIRLDGKSGIYMIHDLGRKIWKDGLYHISLWG